MINLDSKGKMIVIPHRDDDGDMFDEFLTFTSDSMPKFEQIPKPKEFIHFPNEEDKAKIINSIPSTKNYFRGDIFLAGQYPSPDIEIRFNVCGQLNCIGRVIPYTKDVIFAQIEKSKDENGIMGNIVVGEVSVKTDFYGLRNLGISAPLEVQSAIILHGKELMIAWGASPLAFSKPYTSFIEVWFNKFEEQLSFWALACKSAVIDTIMTWVGIQILLLNPVVSVRCKHETMPYGDPLQTASKPKKKQPKKYIKRLIIGDLSDMEFGEKKTKHIKEPFWWVSGHYRTYKNTGKTIFIEGYWKGPFREYGYNGDTPKPRERAIEFGTDMDQFLRFLRMDET